MWCIRIFAKNQTTKEWDYIESTPIKYLDDVEKYVSIRIKFLSTPSKYITGIYTQFKVVWAYENE